MRSTIAKKAPGAIVRVATYTRISTDEEHQPYSLEAQAERLGKYVASQDGWELTRTFTDQCSGATTERPDLQRALREARMGRFDILLVYRVDRLTRSVRGLAQILEELDAAGVGFQSATEPFDTTTPAGRMMVQQLGVFAEFERATIVDRVVAGMEREAAHGAWQVGAAPFGYSIDCGTGFLSPREDEASTVPLMFNLYGQQRLGSASVAHWLNKRGHRTRNRKLWTAPAVLTVLRNTVYVGEITFRGQRHKAPHTPLVEHDLFNLVQSILTERREDWSRRASNTSTYLLAGAVTCEKCGRHYVGGAAHGRSARYRYDTCWSRVRMGTGHCDSDRLPPDAFEAEVIAAARRSCQRDDTVRRAIAASYAKEGAARPDYAAQAAHVEREIAKTDEAIERYLLAFENKTVPEAACGKRIQSLTDELRDLRRRQEELGELVAASVFDAIAEPDIDAFRADVSQLLTGDDIDMPHRKAILQKLVADIRVHSRDLIVPTFRVTPRTPVRTVDGLVPRSLSCSNFEEVKERIEKLLHAFEGAVPSQAWGPTVQR